MDHREIKEEFERMKQDYDWTKDRDRGHFIIPKKHMDYFLDAMEYVLSERSKKKPKQKKPVD